MGSVFVLCSVYKSPFKCVYVRELNISVSFSVFTCVCACFVCIRIFYPSVWTICSLFDQCAADSDLAYDCPLPLHTHTHLSIYKPRSPESLLSSQLLAFICYFSWSRRERNELPLCRNTSTFSFVYIKFEVGLSSVGHAVFLFHFLFEKSLWENFSLFGYVSVLARASQNEI